MLPGICFRFRDFASIMESQPDKSMEKENGKRVLYGLRGNLINILVLESSKMMV